MSRPKFMVFKLSDLKIPFIMLLVVIAAFSFFMLTGDKSEETFAPDNGYKDGMYVANLAFADASMDVVVNVAKNQITSVTLDGFDETERMLYSSLNESVTFVNDYVTATQSLQLPTDSTITASTSILMDAINVALSDDMDASVKTTYEVPLLEKLTDDTSLLAPQGDDVVLEDAATENADAAGVETPEVAPAEENVVPMDPQN